MPERTDFLIVTALEKEKACLPGILGAERLPKSSGDINEYHGARLTTVFDYDYSIVFLCVGEKGGEDTAVAVRDAIRRWLPRYVIMTGIAAAVPGGGRKKGHMLAAKVIVDLSEFKVMPTHDQIRQRSFPCELELVNMLDSFREQSEKWRGISHLGPIIAQKDLVKDANYRNVLRKHVVASIGVEPIGIEMEGKGLAAAVVRTPSELRPGYLLVKAAVDFASYHKNDALQEQAAKAVGEFVRDFLQYGPVARQVQPDTSVVEPKLETATADTKSGKLQQGLLELASARTEQRRTFSIESNIYVHRAEIERQLRERREHNGSWISIEGEAGTGKTTLLHQIHDDILTEAQANGAGVPLFVDSTWLLVQNAAAESPLGWLHKFVPQHIRTGWDLICEVGAQLRSAGVRLVVLLDTVDGALISQAGLRLPHWITVEAPLSGLQVISCCRPLEASIYFPPHRGPLRLKDFDSTEALQAINLYVDSFYARLTPAARAEARRILHVHYLKRPEFEDVCKRPVTLRMLFDVYPDRPPSEAVNRTQLFSRYWNLKVLGEPSARPHRVEPRARVLLAEQLALMMVHERAVRLLSGDVEMVIRNQPAGTKARDDLLSEGVLIEEGQGERRWYSFFHQSFLEYAAARALLEAPADIRTDEIEKLLLPLERSSSSPWFALLEEVAVQAQSYSFGQTIGNRILKGLLRSNIPGAKSAAAVVWCSLPGGPAEFHDQEALANDRLFRYACLDYVHNALPSRIENILSDVGAAAWHSGETDQRLAIMNAWARNAVLVPAAIRAQIERLGVDAFIRHTPALTEALRGSFLEKLGRLYAAFLGVDDGYAVVSLRQLYLHLRDTHIDATLRAKLVADVGTHIEVTQQAAGLIDEWIKTPERPQVRHMRTLRDAFGQALLQIPIDEARLRKEAAWLLKRPEDSVRNDARPRILAGWRARIQSGQWSVGQTVWPLVCQTDNLEMLKDTGEFVLLPLAKEQDKELSGLLLQATSNLKGANPTTLDRIRENYILEALAFYTATKAGEIIDELGWWSATLDDLSGLELKLLLNCVANLPSSATTTLVEKIIAKGYSLRLLELLPSGGSDPRVATLITTALRMPLQVEEQVQLARQLTRFATAIPTDLYAEAVLSLARMAEGSPQEPRREALASLPTILRQLSRGEITASVIGRLRPLWIKRRRDAEAASVGNCLAEVLQFWSPPFATAQAIRKDAIEIVGRDDPHWREAGKSALAVIEQLAVILPDAVSLDVRQLLELLGDRLKTEGAQTDVLVGIANVVYRLADADLNAAWDYAKAIARLAEAGGLGRNGWDSVIATLTGTLRKVLRSPEHREHMLVDVPTLPVPLQAEVVRCAKDDDDSAYFEKLQPLTLGRRASQLLAAWGRMRARKLAAAPVPFNEVTG